MHCKAKCYINGYSFTIAQFRIFRKRSHEILIEFSPDLSILFERQEKESGVLCKL